MTNPFKHFDFRLLDDPDFREDSVREELVAPLLAALGYSASPPHRIIRSRPLQHPYIYIGTVKKPVSIVPDYLLQRDGENAWILDAKGPNETLDSGKNVEQAYSYAIHKDIRVPLYGLCNGRRLVVFHVSHWPAVLDVSLQDVATVWPMLLHLLGTKAAWPQGLRPGFHPDFGLSLRKAGLTHDTDGKKLFQIFASVPIQTVAKLEDNLYTMTGLYELENEQLMVTFDFGPAAYQKFLSELPPCVGERVRSGLARQPYKLYFQEADVLSITVFAEPGDRIITNENESYCPFIAEDFVADPERA